MKKKILTVLCVLLCIISMGFSTSMIANAGTWGYDEPVEVAPYTDSKTNLKIYKDDGIDTVTINTDGSWIVYMRQGCQLTKMNCLTIPKMITTYNEKYNYFIYEPCDSSQYINIKGGVTEVYLKSRLIPDHICDYDEVVTEPTCLYEGYTTYSCPICNIDWVDDYTQPLGHDYVNGVCSRCGKIDTTYNDYILGKTYDPYTGDITPIGWIAIIGLCALIVAFIVIFTGRRKNRKNKK